jgi:hypothetical protein
MGNNEIEEKIETTESEIVEEREEPKNEQSESDLVLQVKAEYEEKIKNIIEENTRKVKERDNVIKELINGNNVEPARDNIEILIDEINQRRANQFKY